MNALNVFIVNKYFNVNRFSRQTTRENTPITARKGKKRFHGWPDADDHPGQGPLRWPRERLYARMTERRLSRIVPGTPQPHHSLRRVIVLGFTSEFSGVKFRLLFFPIVWKQGRISARPDWITVRTHMMSRRWIPHSFHQVRFSGALEKLSEMYRCF